MHNELTRRYMSRFHNIRSHASTILFMLHSKHLRVRNLLSWTEGRLLRIFLFHNFLCSQRVQRSLWELRSTNRRCSMSVYPSLHQLAQYVLRLCGMVWVPSVMRIYEWWETVLHPTWVSERCICQFDWHMSNVRLQKLSWGIWILELDKKKAVCLPDKDVTFLLHSGNYGTDRAANRRSRKRLVMPARRFVLELVLCSLLWPIADKR